MRQRIGPKKVARYSRLLDLDIEKALVRGNTNSRIDLYLKDGRKFCWFRNGDLEQVISKQFPEPEEYVTIGNFPRK